MSRVFVRGISSQTTAQDLSDLFSKVTAVKDVYIPGPSITGLRRDFGIVAIEGDSEEAKKCAKSFSGSLWKGSKLRVEVAEEYYVDRLEREKRETEATQAKLQEVANVQQVVPLPPVSGDVIRLRKIKLQENPIVISMNPSIALSSHPRKPRGKPSKHSLPCGTRLIFDESILPPGQIEIIKSRIDNGVDNEAVNATTSRQSQEGTSSESQPDKVDSKQNSEQKGEMAEIVQKLNTGEVKAIGGGVRKGFGSMSLPAAPPKPVAPQTMSVQQESSRGGKPVHCCIEEHEEFIPDYILDEEDSGDDEPCVTEEDLKHETLERERDRAMDVFNRMLSGELPPKKDKKTLRKEAQEKKKVGFAEEANTEHCIEVEGEEEARPVLSAEAAETLAILNELKGNSHSSAPAVSASVTNDKQEEEDILTTKDGFAKMNQLKDIFYREGGVWWGDDGTLTGAVGKGAAAADPLFLEAEKRGIDIRTLTKSKAGTSGAASSNISGGSDASAGAGLGAIFNFLPGETTAAASRSENNVEEDDKQMIFSFFSEPTTTTAAISTDAFAKPISSTCAVAPMMELLNSNHTVAQDDTMPTRALNEANPTVLSSQASVVDGSGLPARPVLVDLNVAEMVALARKFGREKELDVLNSEWRDGKDRLVLDYKRKRKDMQRRTAAWSSSNVSLSNVFGERERSSSSNTKPDGSHKPSPAAGGAAHYMRGRNRGGAGRKKVRKA